MSKNPYRSESRKQYLLFPKSICGILTDEIDDGIINEENWKQSNAIKIN